MPRLRAEQIFGIGNDIVNGIDHRLTNAHVANDAGIKQSKIEAWQDDATGWITEGLIKMVTTAELPIWDGSQAGQMYYDINTNELWIGLSTQPYYQLIAGVGVASGDEDRELVLKMSYEATNWTGIDDNDPQGTGSIFDLGSDTTAADGSNLMVFLNGVLQEQGSGNDYLIYSDGDPQTDKIQFTYNIEGPDQKLTAVINSASDLVNYATKIYVDEKFFGQSGHDHDGIDSNQLDFNAAITATSLNAIIHNIIPNTNAVDLGSAAKPFGNVYADEGHFAANTIYLGGVAISGTNDTFNVSYDGSTYNEVVLSGAVSPAAINMETPTGETITLTSDTGIFIDGDILPEMTGAAGNVSVRNIGSATQIFSSAYINTINGNASTATILETGRTINISGDITSDAVIFDGSTNITITASVNNDSHTHDTRYYTETESDARFININGDTMSGSLIVQGDLTVSGTTTTINTETTTMADNIIILNSNEAGTPSQNAGLEIERGTETNYQFLFDEASDTFEVGMVGSLQAVATREDTPTTNGVPYWDGTSQSFKTTAAIKFNDTDLEVTGLEVSGGLGGGILFEAGKHQITSNDGGGNFNFRIGNRFINSQHEMTETGYGFHEIWDQTNGIWSFKITPTSQAVGETAALANVMTLTPSLITLSKAVTASAGISGTLTGNASTATKLATARTIDITGDITATAVAFDGSANIAISAAVNNDSHTHSNATLPDYAAGAASVGFLAYNGNTKAAGKLYGGATAPSSSTRLNYDGYFYATRIYNAVYNDIAEFMFGTGEAGQVLVQTVNGVKPASKRGDSAVVGVYSDSYGYALGGDEDSKGKVPVGLSGRVWVWVEEPCSIGDLLITSNKKGFATVKQSAEDGLGKIFAKVIEEKLDSIPQRVEVLILMA